MSYESENTALGVQTLVPGVRPVTLRERLAFLLRQPMQPRKAQKPLDVGLFDADGRRQMDIADLLAGGGQ